MSSIKEQGVYIEHEPNVRIKERHTVLSPLLINVFNSLRDRRPGKLARPDQLSAAMLQYIPGYLRWETARRSESQPYLEPSIATAYEPYLLDLYEDPALVVKHLLTNTKEVLDSAREDIGSDLGHVVATLSGSEFSIPALQYGEQMFLTLREITFADGLEADHPEDRGKKYKNRIQELVEQKGDLQFIVNDAGVSQRIVLPEQKDIVHLTKPRLSRKELETLLGNQKDRFTWNVVELVGQVGHPISRELLTDVNNSQQDEDLTQDEKRYRLFVARMNARNAGIPNSELPKVPLVHG